MRGRETDQTGPRSTSSRYKCIFTWSNVGVVGGGGGAPEVSKWA